MLKNINFLILFLLSTLFLNFGGKVFAIDSNIQAKKIDIETEILTNYLAKYNSPMKDHAQDFVDAAKTYNVDWKLVPSIAGVESTFGKFIPGGYNAWGWGVYGTQAIYFDSWRDGIFTVTKGLKENYINKGLTDPFAMNRIYAASPAWGGHVSFFLSDLEKFEKEYRLKNPTKAQIDPRDNIAALSGQPRSNI